METAEYDPAMAEHAARDLVGEDLDSFNALTRKGMRKFMSKYVGNRRIPGRHAVTNAFDKLVERANLLCSKER